MRLIIFALLVMSINSYAVNKCDSIIEERMVEFVNTDPDYELFIIEDGFTMEKLLSPGESIDVEATAHEDVTVTNEHNKEMLLYRASITDESYFEFIVNVVFVDPKTCEFHEDNLIEIHF